MSERLRFTFRSSRGNGAPTLRRRAQEINLVIIPKDGTQDFWKTVHSGASQAALDFQDQGVQIRFSWKDPGSEEDYRRQLQFLEEARNDQVSGIVLGPLDSRSLVPSVNKLIRAKIPVLIIDSALESEQIVSFVASDNFGAGNLAARLFGTLTQRHRESYFAPAIA